MNSSDSKSHQEPVTMTLFSRMRDQIRILDDALSTIKGFTPESVQARTYVIAQIEALSWACRLFDHEKGR